MVNDFDLTPEQLEQKYDPVGGGEHPGWTRSDWRIAVADEDTISGYWVWVLHKLLE